VYTLFVSVAPGGEEAGSPLSAHVAPKILSLSLPRYVVTSLLRFSVFALSVPRIIQIPARNPFSAHDQLTPLQSALPRKSPVSLAESAHPKSLDLKYFRIRTCEKGRGEGVQSRPQVFPIAADIRDEGFRLNTEQHERTSMSVSAISQANGADLLSLLNQSTGQAPPEPPSPPASTCSRKPSRKHN
jgi:hypothetical protein